MAFHFEIVRDASRCSARQNGDVEFPVGSRVVFRSKRTGIDRYGLSNDRPNFGSDYARKWLFKGADFQDEFAFWSHFIEPTAICEGQSFLSLNTYDSARFTFGFGQFAAHVPNGDFVRWFRDMLQRPEAVDYFPDLKVLNGHIVGVEGSAVVKLEDDDSTVLLQKYLNPTLDEVEDSEAIAAAKFLHWTVNQEGTRHLQVRHMVNAARRLVSTADKRLGLDGFTSDVCCVIFDILHQGRSDYDEMKRALLQESPFEALIEVGVKGEPVRVRNLKEAMTTRRTELQSMKWSSSKADFE